MGGHILRRLRAVEESFENIGSTVSERYPCGFCGQSSLNGVCSMRIQSGKAVSTCSRAYDFKICAASKISKQKACTNVPIQCRFCPEIHWKYNIHRHLQERHPSWERNLITGAKELQEFRDRITMTNEEESRLNIPEEKQGWSAVIYADVHDQRHLNQIPSVRDSRTDSPQRPRPSQRSSAFRVIPPISFLIPPRPNYTSTSQLLPTLNTPDVSH